MAVVGGLAYASWTVVIIMVGVLVCGAYILKNLVDSNYENACSSKPESVEDLKTTYRFTLGLVITFSVIGIIAFILAIVFSVKSLKTKSADFSQIRQGIKGVLST